METATRPYVVYRLIFPDGKSYVGCTRRFSERMRSHEFAARYGGTRPVQKALHACGWDAVGVVALAEGLTEDEAYALEIAKIIEFDSKLGGHNCADGGRVNRGHSTGPSWNKGGRLSDTHRQALRAAKSGKSYATISSNNSTRYPVVATNDDGQMLFFKNAIACAAHIGVSYSAVYRHIYRNAPRMRCGWTVRRVQDENGGQ